MIDSVLRVYGEEFDVDSFLVNNSLTIPFESYRKGDDDILGNPNMESGFDALLSENESVVDHLAEVRNFLSSNQSLFDQLQSKGAKCIIDLGFTVGGAGQLTQSIPLPVELLGICHQLQVAIEVSAYPSSDEQNQS